MEYNKQLFKKTNDKKILHKVRKHWVVVSMALLGAIGATGLVKSNVSANQANVDASNQNNLPNNKVSSIVKKPGASLVTSGFKSNVNSSENINVGRVSHIKAQTNNLSNRILAQLNQSSRNSGNLNKRISDSSASGQSQRQGKLSQISQPHVLGREASMPEVGDAGNAYQNAINNDLQDIQNKIDMAGTLNSDAFSEINSAKAASVSANAQLNRYADIDPQNTDFNRNDSNYGTATVFGFSDSSSAAKNDNKALNNDLLNMPSASAIQDSVKVTFVNSMANSIADNIDEDTTSQQYQEYLNQVDSLKDTVDTAYNDGSIAVNSISSMASDAGDQAVNISQAFSSVSAAADSAGKTFNSATPTTEGDLTGAPYTNAAYGVVNVDNANEFINAYMNINVHQINLNKNIDFWHTYANEQKTTLNNPGDVDNSNDDWYYYPMAHNITINGLNDNGSWKTIDTAHVNINQHTVPAGGSSWAVTRMKNLHMYTENYWGCFSVNNESVIHALQIYDNTTFVGSQLAYNDGNSTTIGTDDIFEGKNIMDAGSSYSPDGKYTQYGYDNNGISPHPFNGDLGPDVVYPEGVIYNQYDQASGVNTMGDQQLMEITADHGVTFKPDSNFIGSTTSGNGFEIYGDGYVHLDRDAHATLIPRGQYSEDTNYLPAGIWTTSSGNADIQVGAGAKLSIIPKIDTSPYLYTYSGFAPAAIHASGGDIVIHNGGTFYVDYPDIQGKKDSNGNWVVAPHSIPNGDDSYCSFGGAVDMTGNTYIEAMPYSNLIVDAGKPTQADAQSINALGHSNDTVDGAQGVLVNFGGTGAAGRIKADQNSNVRLRATGGNQNILLFQAPTGTDVSVTDPKRFSLNLNGNFENSGKKSQLASSGVAIEGTNVTAYDEHIDKNNNYTNSFGQFNDIVLPGLQYDIPQYLKKEVSDACTDLTNHGLSADYNNVITNATLITILKLIPFGFTSLNNQSNLNGLNRFNDSVDLSSVIAKVLGNNTLSNTIKSDNHDETMYYDGHQIPIHKGGFNLTKGFAFEAVPQATQEGVHYVKNSDGTYTVSGYAYPGSYIRLTDGNDYAQNNSGNNPEDPPLVYNPSLQRLNDSAYDPRDSSHQNDYVAIAKDIGHGIGYWSYTLPASDSDKLGNLVATAHTATVGNPNAARLVTDYKDRMNDVKSKDSVSAANDYYHNISNFPSDTYPGYKYPGITYKTDNEYINDPSNHQDDPTYTDDDDDGTVNYTIDKDHDNPDDIHGSYQHYTYDGTGTINDRNSYQIDDGNAGQYFEAGRLKGDEDLDQMITDNSIYSMPYPFIVGYLTAKANRLNPQDINDNIDKALKIVIGDYNDVFNDWLPRIKQDGSNADVNLNAIGLTMNTLNSLINYKDQSSANPFSYYPYSNLQSLANNISPNAIAASGYELSEFNYDGENHSGSSANNQTLASDVTNIDQLLDDATQTLKGYKHDVHNDALNYDSDYNAASSAAKAGESVAKEVNLLTASAIYKQANTYNTSASSVATSATNEDTIAHSDASSADFDSNSVAKSVSAIRTPTSNSEASDFNSVADSYAESANYDARVINRDYREVNHRYHQLSLADNVFASDSAEINSLSSSVSDEIKIGNLTGDSSTDASSAGSAISSASAELSNASSIYNYAMSNFASSGYTSESNARAEISNLSSILGSEGFQTSVENSIQSMDINSGDFDGASDVNIGFGNMESSTYDGSDKASTYDHRGVFYSLLDKANDISARNDLSGAASAQARVRSLSYKMQAMTRMMPMLVRSIMLGAPATSSDDRKPSVSPNNENNNANHSSQINNNSVQNNYIKVVSVKEDANGHVTDSESQSFPVNRPVGSDYVVSPQDFIPSGYHAVNDQIVNDPMMANGLSQKQVSFTYQVDNPSSDHNGQGIVNILYVNANNNDIVHTEPVYGSINKPFNLSQYDGHLPNGYRFNSVADGSNVNTFTAQPQNVTIKVTPISSQTSSVTNNSNTPARPQSSSANNHYVPSHSQSSSSSFVPNSLPNSSSSNQNRAGQRPASDFDDNSANGNYVPSHSQSSSNSFVPNASLNSDSSNQNRAYQQSASAYSNNAVDKAQNTAKDGEVSFWDTPNSNETNDSTSSSSSSMNSSSVNSQSSNSVNNNSFTNSNAHSDSASSDDSTLQRRMNSQNSTDNDNHVNGDSSNGDNSASSDDPDGSANTGENDADGSSADGTEGNTGSVTDPESSAKNAGMTGNTSQPSRSYVDGVRDALRNDSAKQDSASYMHGYMDQKRSGNQELPQTGDSESSELAIALLMISSSVALAGLSRRRRHGE